MRRLLLLYIACILLPLSIPKTRAIVLQQADRPEVQAFLNASEAKRQLAATALWRYVGEAKTVVNGKVQVPNTGIVPESGDFALVGAGCTLTTDQAEAI